MTASEVMTKFSGTSTALHHNLLSQLQSAVTQATRTENWPAGGHDTGLSRCCGRLGVFDPAWVYGEREIKVLAVRSLQVNLCGVTAHRFVALWFPGSG